MTAQPQTHNIHGSTQCPASETRVPFEWEEPGHGPQVHGEVSVVRPFGTSGTLSAGLWRTGPNSPGCKPNGSNIARYTSPLDDETACVIDGTATLTVVSTGKQHRVGPGSVISSPKGVEVEWAIDGPFFKQFSCIWAGSSPVAGEKLELQINHVSDNPPDEEWIEYHFTEPKEGSLVAGALYFIRNQGSSGTMMSGVWRARKGFPGSDVKDDGTMTTPYTGVLGDETILLLEGEVEVIETASGKKHNFRLAM